MPSARNQTVTIERAYVTPDSVAVYDSLSRSTPGVIYHTSLNLTNGHCDCDCKRQSCHHWPALRDAGYTVLTIWMPAFHCIHIRLAIADSISRGERGDVGEINVLETPPQKEPFMPSNSEHRENEMPHVKPLAIAKIRTDSGAQFRTNGIDQEHVDRMAEAIERGKKLPAVLVFSDGENYWLSKGFHRFAAHVARGEQEILAEIRTGTVDDARIAALGGNEDNGLPRAKGDAKREVLFALQHDQLKMLDTDVIADLCKVKVRYVQQLRSELYKPKSDENNPKRTSAQTTTDTTLGDNDNQMSQDFVTGNSFAVNGDDDAQNQLDDVDRAHLAAQNSTGTPKDDTPKTPEEDLTNDEWLNTLPLWEQLRGYEHQGYLFRTAALAYRNMEPVIKQLRKLHKDEFGGKAIDGAFPQHIGSIALTPHPSKWVLCGACNGSLSCEQSQCSCKGGYRLW